ncbi:DegQ family serine endoprotease [Indioceanicola profundi]|uniref:DegQ family serine endoprotease n=1 Tax=Indioceanicola profundi TaxID=2220096 RepID=UPI001CED58EB|nr:DegQ family serine endoprotease [Indioceanicola profundi]
MMKTRSILRAGAAVLALSLAMPIPVQPTYAQSRAVPQSREQITLSFAPVVKQASPAVVNIYTRRTVRQRVSPFMDDPVFRRFFGESFSFGVPRERVEGSLGSGVIVAADGLVVTNAHVVKGSDEITVVLNDRREFPAKVETVDERVDLAVLRIEADGEKLPFLEFGESDDLEVGDLVLAIGNPFGVGQTVTSGIVSALARTAVGVSDYNFFIQTDAAVNPGNSGGALITMDGRLVGINTAIYSRSGGSIGIGFAIPAAMVRTVVDAVRAGGKLVRPWIGADGQAVTADLAHTLGLSRPAGVLINEIRARGPAEKAGLRVGDVVTAVNGRSVDDPEAMRYRVATLPVGGSATLTVIRDGREQKLNLALIAPPEDPPRDLTLLDGRHPLVGAEVANLNPALVEEMRFDEGVGTEGVVVMQVAPRTPAASLGLRPGDVVLRVNATDIGRVQDLRHILDSRSRSWTISVRRNGRVMTTTIGG